MSNQPQLRLLNLDLSALPELILPEGVTLHSEREDSPEAWSRIIDESFGCSFDYQKTIRESLGYRPEGVLFLSLDGRDVATTTAVEHRDFPGYGWIHMVGIHSEARGRGLARPMVLAAMWELKRRGFTKVGLTTDDFRIPAIRTYLGLGFKPHMYHSSHPERWRAVFEQIDAMKSGRI